ncbi:hypothetical protein CCYA_CCYA01G0269 [Cyanidiococcus yangmingshanensis]|nr:hypothetical protein CCYA_CCYA01G0269 [Cyanidiococcus yangmingshanensis]
MSGALSQKLSSLSEDARNLSLSEGLTQASRSPSPAAPPSHTVREDGAVVSTGKNQNVVAASAAQPTPDFPVTGPIGPHLFQKLKLLGKGDVGRVYLVLLKGTTKLYAMKVLTKEEMIARNKVKRVLTEREILATAHHPFIVTMYASFQTKDRLYFIMEYCAGGEFFRVLQRQPNKRLPEDAVRFYAAEVLLALEYLHHMGFIYRDLKPENILMRADGHIALTDFDLSKQAHPVSPRVIKHQMTLLDRMKGALSGNRGSRSNLQDLEIVDSEPVLPYATNSFVGTEEYIAPEVIQGVGHTSDVDWWTFGILLYEMLTGTTPFKGSYQDETFNNIVHGNIRFDESLHLSQECKNLIKRLLKRDASKRLGHENGASDIKRHPWFRKIDFNLIRNETPPIVPKVRDPLDFSQYPPLKDKDLLDDVEPFDENSPANPFKNFASRKLERGSSSAALCFAEKTASVPDETSNERDKPVTGDQPAVEKEESRAVV